MIPTTLMDIVYAFCWAYKVVIIFVNFYKTPRVLLMRIFNQLTSILLLDHIVLNGMHVHNQIFLKVVTTPRSANFCVDFFYGLRCGILLFIRVTFGYEAGDLVWIDLWLPFSISVYLKERYFFEALSLLTLDIKPAFGSFVC